ncbi:MAG: hypothetical protein Q4P36_03920 [Bowdeniella nasicola]|nr:hypothetical protein [Bowdeniella nasicola]
MTTPQQPQPGGGEQPQPGQGQPPQPYGQPSEGTPSIETPEVVTQHMAEIRQGLITGALTWVGSFVLAILSYLIMVASSAPMKELPLVSTLFTFTGTAFGGGLHVSGSVGDEPGRAALSATMLTGTIIVGILAYVVLAKLRKSQPFSNLKGVTAGAIAMFVAIYLLHLVTGLVSLAFSTDFGLRIRSNFALPIFVTAVLAVVVYGYYQLRRTTRAAGLGLWLLRARQALPYLVWMMLGTGAILSVATFLQLVVSGLSFSFGYTDVNFIGALTIMILLAGIYVLMGPALVFGAPITAAVSEYSGMSVSQSIYSAFDGWLIALIIIASVALLIFVSWRIRKEIGSAPLIRTGVFAGTFGVVGLVTFLLTQYSLKIDGGSQITSFFGSSIPPMKLRLSFLAVVIFILVGAAVDLIARYGIPVIMGLLADAKKAQATQEAGDAPVASATAPYQEQIPNEAGMEPGAQYEAPQQGAPPYSGAAPQANAEHRDPGSAPQAEAGQGTPPPMPTPPEPTGDSHDGNDGENGGLPAPPPPA